MREAEQADAGPDLPGGDRLDCEVGDGERGRVVEKAIDGDVRREVVRCRALGFGLRPIDRVVFRAGDARVESLAPAAGGAVLRGSNVRARDDLARGAFGA